MLLLLLVVIPVSVVVQLLECEGEYRGCEDLNDYAWHIVEVPAHSVDSEGEEGQDKRAGERRFHGNLTCHSRISYYYIVSSGGLRPSGFPCLPRLRPAHIRSQANDNGLITRGPFTRRLIRIAIVYIKYVKDR